MKTMKKLFSSKAEQQIVTEIHNEFDTAQDRLLDEADKLLNELSIETETSIELKAEELIKLGFVNVEIVHKSTKLKNARNTTLNKIVETKEQAELIRYYKQQYPFQKFLTELELERICEKYNLIFAPVSNYIKDVPDKNINEIKNSMALAGKDLPINKCTLNIKSFYSSCPNEIRELFSKEVPYPLKKEYENSPSDTKVLMLAKEMGYSGDYSSYIFDNAELKEESKQGLFIAAPKSHFNTKGLTKKGKYSFFTITKTEINDPIVFRFVRGGIQVLSKWGLEGKDESLINEKLN